MDTPNPRQQPTTFNEVVLNRTLNQGNKYNIRLMRYLLDDLANVDSHNGIFLDVGGGWGHLTLLAKDLGFDAICLDRENISGMVNAVCCDIIEDTFPFPSNSVSVVFCKSTLEHLYVNQLPHFISEVQRVLARRKSYSHDARLGYKYTKLLYSIFARNSLYIKKP